MKDLIVEKLSKIQNLEERKLLKDILQGVFVNVVDYNEEMFQSLTKDIFEEIQYDENRYAIYTSLAARDDIDPIHEFLYPMISEDLEEQEYDETLILEEMQQKRECKLMKLYLECDYLIIKELIDSNSEFDGKIITNQGSYEIKVRMKQTKDYLKCIEDLYETFIRNGIVWTTINSPYINKFVDVYLTDWEAPIKKGEKIQEITLSLGKYEDYTKMDMVPLWNIKTLQIPTLTFPIPAMDHINYQHELSLRSEGEEHGYLVLVDENFNGYIKRNKDSLTICAPSPDIVQWKILKVAAFQQSNFTLHTYEIMSNKTKNSFINRYARQQSKVIRTKAELHRIIDSFEVSKNLEFKDFYIVSKETDQGETYSMDFFLTDGIREESYKKILMLEFKCNQFEFLTRDIMSFIVSEIQQYFPEYVCKGKLEE